MTFHITAYDVETPDCLDAVKRIVHVHERREAPATFFIAGRLLDIQAAEYKALLKGHPLFEIACRASTELDRFINSEEAGFPDALRAELISNGKRIEHVFNNETPGFRAQAKSERGLRDNEALLDIINEAGFGYLSTLPKNPDTVPLHPRSHTEKGFPHLWELPPYNLAQRDAESSPQEEFELRYKPVMERAVAENLTHLSFIMRTKELNVYDPTMESSELIFEHARRIKMQEGTFADLHREMLRKQRLASGRR